MEQIKWTTKSLKDLKAINDFISLDSKFYAARFINRLIQRVDQLVLFPDSGRIVPEKNNPEIRELYRKRSEQKVGYFNVHARFNAQALG